MTIDNSSTPQEAISEPGVEAQTTEVSPVPTDQTSLEGTEGTLEGTVQEASEDDDLRGETAYQDQQAEQLYTALQTGEIAHEAVVGHDIF